MDNDIRYGRSPRIGRGVGSVLVATLALLGSLLVLAGAGSLVDTAVNGLSDPVSVDLPLQRDDLDAITDRWNGPVTVEPQYSSSLGAMVSGLDERTMTQLLTAHIITRVESLLIGLLVGIPAALHLSGRLRWHTLGRAVTAGGMVAAAGALAHSFFYGVAIVFARDQASPEGLGMETAPFLGWDFPGMFVGCLFVVLGIALNRVARFARETDGVV